MKCKVGGAVHKSPSRKYAYERSIGAYECLSPRPLHECDEEAQLVDDKCGCRPSRNLYPAPLGCCYGLWWCITCGLVHCI